LLTFAHFPWLAREFFADTVIMPALTMDDVVSYEQPPEAVKTSVAQKLREHEKYNTAVQIVG